MPDSAPNPQLLRSLGRLAELYEADLLDGSPSPAERQALDEAFAEFERDPSPGEPWRKVFSEIRAARIRAD